MKEENEIVEGNKMIALFHHADDFGWKIKDDKLSERNGEIYVWNNQLFLCTGHQTSKELCYHTDWNLLMPVVEKISLLEIKDDEVIHNGEDSFFDS